MSINFFSRFKDIIIDNLKGLLRVDKKVSYSKSFVDLLTEQRVNESVISKLRVEFDKSISFLNDNNNLDSVSNLIWLILVTNLEKCLLHINSVTDIECKDFIVCGLPGSGKTTFIRKFISYLGINSVNYTGSDSSSSLLRIHYNGSTCDLSSQYSFRECEDVSMLGGMLSSSYNSKVVLVLDCNTSYSITSDLLKSLCCVDYIVLSKVDCMRYGNLLVELSTLTKSKLFFCTNSEISDLKSELVSASFCINLLSLKFLKKKLDKKDLNSLLDLQYTVVDMNSYRMYLQFINNIDREKILNLSSMYEKAAPYLSQDDINKYKSYLEKIKSPDAFAKVSKNAMLQIYVIDSMNREERRSPLIINHNRRKEIIYGSGVNSEIFDMTISSFLKYKDALRDISNKKNKFNGLLNNV